MSPSEWWIETLYGNPLVHLPNGAFIPAGSMDWPTARRIVAAMNVHNDLLAALRFAASELPQESNACEQARAAIAKAEDK